MLHSVVAGREKKRWESHKAQCKCLKMRDPQKPSKSIWLGSQLFLKFVSLHLFRVLNLCICHNTCSLWCFSLVLLQHPRNRHSLIGFHLKLVKRFTPPLLSINGRLPLSGGWPAHHPPMRWSGNECQLKTEICFKIFLACKLKYCAAEMHQLVDTFVARLRLLNLKRHWCEALRAWKW